MSSQAQGQILSLTKSLVATPQKHQMYSIFFISVSYIGFIDLLEMYLLERLEMFSITMLFISQRIDCLDVAEAGQRQQHWLFKCYKRDVCNWILRERIHFQIIRAISAPPAFFLCSMYNP